MQTIEILDKNRKIAVDFHIIENRIVIDDYSEYVKW